jgi:hypothetical protein
VKWEPRSSAQSIHTSSQIRNRSGSRPKELRTDPSVCSGTGTEYLSQKDSIVPEMRQPLAPMMARTQPLLLCFQLARRLRVISTITTRKRAASPPHRAAPAVTPQGTGIPRVGPCGSPFSDAINVLKAPSGPFPSTHSLE